LASKDQAIGGIIFLVCLIVAIGYIIVLASPKVVLGWVSPGLDEWAIRFWAVAVVVLIAFLAIMFIGAWIGWTMATTPPPKPIEELEKEIEEEKPTEEEIPSEKTEEVTEKKPETVTSEAGTRKRRRKSKEK